MLNVGIIGAGLWGGQHAHVFSTLHNTRVAAVCDQDPARAQAMAGRCGAQHSFSSHHDLLALAEIDAVSIATPDFSHTDLILDALAAGKHVLTEKPLATTVADAEAVVRAAEASGRVLMVDFHNRVSPVIAAARSDVGAGQIGRPVHLSARLSNTRYVPQDMLAWAARSSALWFLGSHTVDALRFILQDEVVEVFALRSEGVLKAAGVDTADVHLALLRFGKGTIGTLENSWVLSRDNPQIFDFRIEIVGEGGQLSLNPSHNGAYSRLGGEGLKFQDMFGVTPAGVGRVGGFVHEAIARFVDTVSTGAPLLATAQDGLMVTRVLAAIEDSARTGLPVAVSD